MPGIHTTPAVRWLLIVNIGVFLTFLIFDSFFGMHLGELFALVPAHFFERHAYWQCMTYLFIHADLFHIIFNMLILWMIGSELENKWGVPFFLKYYFVCGISAGVFYLFVQLFFQKTLVAYLPMMGSSGAIYGLLVAYGIIYSERVLLFMMLFPMKAKHFVVFLAVIEFISTVFYTRSGVANAAHLGGMIVGFVYLYINAWLRIRARQKKTGRPKRVRKGHLRLVVNNEVIQEFEKDDEVEEPDRPTFH